MVNAIYTVSERLFARNVYGKRAPRREGGGGCALKTEGVGQLVFPGAGGEGCE